MTPRQHAEILADAIQRFRNLPMLAKLTELRKTPEYGALCDAWNDWIADGGARLHYADLAETRASLSSSKRHAMTKTPAEREYYEEDEDFADEEDDLGEACGRWDNGSLGAACALAGTEFCDWDCPYGD